MYNYEIYCGKVTTMESVAKRGVRALNPRTMRYQLVDRRAKYLVTPDGIGATLCSNLDLRAIAAEQKLIL